MPPKEEPSELEKAKMSRVGAAGWFTRSAKPCELICSQDLKVVDFVEYETALTNFNTRLAAWDESQEGVERLIEEAALEEDIGLQADNCAKMGWAKLI